MNAGLRRTAQVLALLVAPAMAVTASAQGFPSYKDNTEWNPTDAEVRALPDYCQRQFRPAPKVPGVKSTSSGRRTCPVNMNHFCPGLVALNRSKNPLGSQSQRRFVFKIAAKKIADVQKEMKQYPNCSRAADVDRAAREVQMLRMFMK